MDPKLYKAAASGDVGFLNRVANADTQRLLSKAPQENTALHIAAKFGHALFARRILELRSELLKMKNSDDDTALHCAARAGYLSAAQILMELEKKEGGSSSTSVELLKLWNKEGDTALHVALKNRQEGVAIEMVRADPRLPFALNYANETPFLVAAREEMVGVVMEILVGNSTSAGQQADSINNSTSSDTVIRINALPLAEGEKMELVSIQDNNGRTALHYAAWRNNAKIVRMILQTDRCHVPYIVDKNGYSPLHAAVGFGCRRSMSVLLKCCPDTIEQVDTSGRNVLHIALLERKFEIIPRLLKEPHIGGLLDALDKEGNTPFHLASKPETRNGWVVRKTREMVAMRNKKEYGQTAPTKRRSLLRVRPQQMPDLNPETKINLQVRKDQNQVFVVVASLIATVTFAAAFTLPGGYRSSNEPHPGTAVLVSKPAFQAFLLFDTLAMCCSVWAIFLYLNAWGPIHVQKQPGMAIRKLKRGNRFTLIACVCMLIAFSAGVFVVIAHDCMWLAIILLAITCCASIPMATTLTANIVMCWFV